MKNQNLSVIVNTDINTPKRLASGDWYSGVWAITEEQAQSFIGGLFSVHTKQKDDSHHQGIVLGYEKVGDRFAIIYRFINNSVTGKSLAWGQEKAIY